MHIARQGHIEPPGPWHTLFLLCIHVYVLKYKKWVYTIACVSVRECICIFKKCECGTGISRWDPPQVSMVVENVNFSVCFFFSSSSSSFFLVCRLPEYSSVSAKWEGIKKSTTKKIVISPRYNFWLFFFPPAIYIVDLLFFIFRFMNFFFQWRRVMDFSWGDIKWLRVYGWQSCY